MTVTSVETNSIKTGAYFCEPTEKTKKVHENLIQMCLADLAKSQASANNKNEQFVKEGGAPVKKKKYRKRTDEEKSEKSRKKSLEKSKEKSY
jgi:hypothetical protein